MKTILEYLSTKVEQTKIKATNETIQQIVKDELDRLGHDCDLNHIDTSQVTSMINLFRADHEGAYFTMRNEINPDVSKWNTENLKEAMCMFLGCVNFDCDLGSWDTHSLENTGAMFFGCEKFNQDINSWNTDNLFAMTQMFSDCHSFNKPLHSWNVSSVKWMRQLFMNCKNFNQDISNWKIIKGANTGEMFLGCPIKNEFKPKSLNKI